MLQKVKFYETDDVREFVYAARKCNFDIDVCYNRITVDAKSLLGILSISLDHEMLVKCHGEDEEFNKMIRKFAVS